MTALTKSRQLLVSCLVGILAMNGVVLGALFNQAPPVPPAEFGPFIGATLALAAAVIPLCVLGHPAGRIGAVLVGLMSVPTMGPHKFFLAPQPLVHAPVILVGTLLVVTVVWAAVSGWHRAD